MLFSALAVVLASGAVDLPQLSKRGTLRVLVFSADEDALPRAASPQALERALLAEFAERNGLTVDIVAETDFEKLFTRLLDGEGDVIAHGLTVTPERERRVAFSRPVTTVSQLLVGKKGSAGLPRSSAALRGQAVVVHQRSAYAETVIALGGVVQPAPEALDSEGVLYQVSQGTWPLTVTDSNLFASASSYNPDLEALCVLAEGKALAWALRPDAVALKSALDAFLIEKALTGHFERLELGDLDAITKRGSLRVLTWNDPLSYFAYKGELFGFDYELARLLAKRLKVRLEILVPPERELLLPWLLDGHGDLVAAALHPVQYDGVTFTAPYAFTDELAVGAAVPAAHSPHVTDDVELLETGRANVVDRLLLDALPSAPTAPISVIATERPVAYAVRSTSPALQAAVDGFVAATYRGLDYNVLKRTYFKDNKAMDVARTNEAGATGQLGPFDAVFREHAARVGLDWRLLAAQCFQESRFDPKARSWAGAVGLCQFTATTAREHHITRREDPRQSVRAAADYMASLMARLDSRLELKQRLRFALAAYNVGLAHVVDAQRLATARGLDPTKWFDHVEKAMLLLEKPAFHRRARRGYCRGSETVKYVSEIQARYDRYVKLVPR